MFEVWSEGYTVTGNSSGPINHGMWEGETFRDAVSAFRDSLPTQKERDYIDVENMSYWGCKLYNKQSDLRCKEFSLVPLELRVSKAAFILKVMLERWKTLGEDAVETSTYKMTEEALNILKGDLSETEVLNVDIDEKTWVQIAEMAHEKDITFNQMVEWSIRKQLEDPELKKLLNGEMLEDKDTPSCEK